MEARDLLKSMKSQSCHPSEITYTSVLDACASSSDGESRVACDFALELLSKMEEEDVCRGGPTEMHVLTVAALCSRCGYWEAARGLWRRYGAGRGGVLHAAAIAACGAAGLHKQALEVLREVPSRQRDGLAYARAAEACAKAGQTPLVFELLEEAKGLEIKRDRGIYHAAIRALGN